MVIIVLLVAGVLLVGAVVAVMLRRLGRRSGSTRRAKTPARRILLPFFADALSAQTLLAALRVAKTEGATLVPIRLVRIPRQLPLDAPVPPQGAIPMLLITSSKQRADEFGVPINQTVIGGHSRVGLVRP